MNRYFFVGLLLFSISYFSTNRLYAQEIDSTQDSTQIITKHVFLTIRLGQGGFTDNRSEINKLGGGQMTLDISISKYPIIFSIISEYYTNSPDATHSYEIPNLLALNLLYKSKIMQKERLNFFAGGGLGYFQVPKDNTESYYYGIGFNTELGLNIRVIWKFGLYGVYKFLYANRKVNSISVIDFSEHILLFGITLNLAF